MNIFKITDICISLAMLIIFSIRFNTEDRLDWLFESYFITGGWQSISMLIHALNKLAHQEMGHPLYLSLDRFCQCNNPAGWFLLDTGRYSAIYGNILYRSLLF